MVKNIPTFYKGYEFRSRSEARWAVFFDTLNMQWTYEPEGYTLSSGVWYLPDFYLLESNTYFEVKGADEVADLSKIIALGRDLRAPVAVGFYDITFQADADFSYNAYELEGKEDSWLVRCRKCKKYFFLGSSGGWACRCCGFYDGDNTFSNLPFSGDLCNMDDKFYTYNDPVIRAVVAARRARFEHGETPKV